MKIKNSPSSSSCNDISPPQSPLLDSTQLDQLSNNLRMMSIDDESINKVLEKLKTIEIQPFDYEAVVRPECLLQFVLFRFKHLFLKMDKRKAIEMYERNQNIILQNQNNEQQIDPGALGRLISQNSDLLQFILANNEPAENNNVVQQIVVRGRGRPRGGGRGLPRGGANGRLAVNAQPPDVANGGLAVNAQPPDVANGGLAVNAQPPDVANGGLAGNNNINWAANQGANLAQPQAANFGNHLGAFVGNWNDLYPFF